MSNFQSKLKSLGFETYQQYLSSDHWKSFSARVRAAFCFCCTKDKTALQVHHHCYDRLGEELDSDVVTVCRPCHETIHQMVKEGLTILGIAHLVLHRKFFPPYKSITPPVIYKETSEIRILLRPLERKK